MRLRVETQTSGNLSLLPLGDSVYFNSQARRIFTYVCRLLRGRLDETGRGLPFTLNDVAICVKGIGADRDRTPTRRR